MAPVHGGVPAASWAHRNRRPLGFVGATASAGMVALWLIVVPDKAQATSGVQSLAIHYGHPAAWACLTVLGLLVAADAPQSCRNVVSWTGLVSYVAFLVSLAL